MAYKPHTVYPDTNSEESDDGDYPTVIMSFLRKYRRLYTSTDIAVKLGLASAENEKDAAIMDKVAVAAEYLHDIGAIYRTVVRGDKYYGYDATTAYHLGQHYGHKRETRE